MSSKRLLKIVIGQTVLGLFIAMGMPALAACDPATNAEAVREVRQAINKYRRSLDVLKGLGVPIGPIENYLRVLASAVEKGVDIAEAAGEVDAEMQRIAAKNERLCDLAYSDDDSRWVCYAKFARSWQARNVKAVLNWNDSGSVIRRAVNKWLGSRCDRAADHRPKQRSSSNSDANNIRSSGSRPIRGACVITGTCNE